ncbi:MAG: bifunctional phosphopantothenoylcysteine decarboxylase/phosphopantothenate--cysteine ligase CoaBC [Pseudomonadota bacterium]
MKDLSNNNILLGISAGIAAYKSCEIVRLLVKKGANVRVVMTENAKQFVTPISLQSLSGNPVRTEIFDTQAESAMSHIELARWADIFIVAPASADIIAKISHGFADSLLTTVWLASNAKKMIAPAMNQHMWQAQVTRKNINLLEQQGSSIIGPDSGEQACGDIGPGRMSEADDIVNQLCVIAKPLKQSGNKSLSQLKVMITAGPTIEDIDPVRFISNRSSGKMGYAIANAAIQAGADVTLISGPTQLPAPSACQFHCVKTAKQMLQQVMKEIELVDIFIACAAVADYRVDQIAQQKLKKKQDTLELKLVKNPDIIQQVASIAKQHNKGLPFSVAFAAETNDLKSNAQQKLHNKGVDLVAANWVGQAEDGKTIGFDQDENELFLFWPKGELHLEKTSKQRLAEKLIEKISQLHQFKIINRLS